MVAGRCGPCANRTSRWAPKCSAPRAAHHVQRPSAEDGRHHRRGGTLTVARAILLESYISFLGYGIQPPMASWGNMLNNAQRYFTGRRIAIFPGVMITLAVTSSNFLGDGLRDSLDPRHGRRERASRPPGGKGYSDGPDDGRGGGGGRVDGTSIAYALASRGVKNAARREGRAGEWRLRAVERARAHALYQRIGRAPRPASFPVFKHWSDLIGGPARLHAHGLRQRVAPAYADNLQEERRHVAWHRHHHAGDHGRASPRQAQPFANVATSARRPTSRTAGTQTLATPWKASAGGPRRWARG